jgi:hypothetical protein
MNNIAATLIGATCAAGFGATVDVSLGVHHNQPMANPKVI